MSKLSGKMKIIPFVIILGVLAFLATVLIFHCKNGGVGLQ